MLSSNSGRLNIKSKKITINKNNLTVFSDDVIAKIRLETL